MYSSVSSPGLVMDLVHCMPLDMGEAELTHIGNQEYSVTTDYALWLQQWQ